MSPGHGKQAHLDLADPTNSTTEQGNVHDITAQFEGLSKSTSDDSHRQRSRSRSRVSIPLHMQEGRASEPSSEDGTYSDSEDDPQEGDYVVSGDEKSVIHGQASSNHGSDLVLHRSASPHVAGATTGHPSTGPQEHPRPDRKVGFTPSTEDRNKRKHRSDKPRSAGDPVPGHRRSHTSQGKTKTGTGNVSL